MEQFSLKEEIHQSKYMEIVLMPRDQLYIGKNSSTSTKYSNQYNNLTEASGTKQDPMGPTRDRPSPMSSALAPL